VNVAAGTAATAAYKKLKFYHFWRNLITASVFCGSEDYKKEKEHKILRHLNTIKLSHAFVILV